MGEELVGWIRESCSAEVVSALVTRVLLFYSHVSVMLHSVGRFLDEACRDSIGENRTIHAARIRDRQIKDNSFWRNQRRMSRAISFGPSID
jgi:hypothetical protein